ncbi:MAG TPA: hypothetical protein ENK18_26550 [Deltaproteobacteria bacterium]|nr:hypothetical protein [Deltaproteobacteria bacterium]
MSTAAGFVWLRGLYRWTRGLYRWARGLLCVTTGGLRMVGCGWWATPGSPRPTTSPGLIEPSSVSDKDLHNTAITDGFPPTDRAHTAITDGFLPHRSRPHRDRQQWRDPVSLRWILQSCGVGLWAAPGQAAEHTGQGSRRWLARAHTQATIQLSPPAQPLRRRW